MYSPVKVLLNAVNVESRNGEWLRPLGTNYEKELGFFRPAWYRYLPPLKSTCLLLRLTHKEDGSPVNKSGIVFGMNFDDRLDYVELSVGMPQHTWKHHCILFTENQGWFQKQDRYTWPALPDYVDT